MGHFQGDPEVYRDKKEVTLLREKDPIVRMRQYLMKEHGIEEQRLAELENKAKREVDAAYQFARESDYPEPEDALKDLFV
jgi:pyruvate dehydrogenase E1 component alpha subunit